MELRRLVDARVRAVLIPGTHDVYDRASIYRSYDLPALAGAVGSAPLPALPPRRTPGPPPPPTPPPRATGIPGAGAGPAPPSPGAPERQNPCPGARTGPGRVSPSRSTSAT